MAEPPRYSASSTSILPATTSLSKNSLLPNPNTRLRDLKLLSDAKHHRKRMGIFIFRRMRRKVDYLQNPRHRRTPRVAKALQLHIWTDKREDYSTLPEPPSVVFDGYEIGSTYTARLRVLNASNWSQSIRIVPPTSDYFHVSSDELCLNGTVLRPGQSCKFSVTFISNSRSKVEDLITVRCEACAVTLVLVARNPFPWVELPSTVNIGACIVGHRLPFLLSLLSLGAGANYKLFMNDDPVLVHEKPFQSNNVLKGHDFVIYPTQFKLQKNESGDIIILFIPSSPGKFVLHLKVVTECGAEWESQVIGYGTNLQISVEESHSGQGVTELWFGHATVSSMNSQRTVLVKNLMSVPIRYYWRIDGNNIIHPSIGDTSLKPFQAAFTVDPIFGVIDAESEVLFTFTFKPEDTLFYNKKAFLYVDTRKCYALQTVLWKQLKEILDHLQFSKCNMETWDKEFSAAADCTDDEGKQGNDVENAGCIKQVAEIKLSGYADPLQVELEPPLLEWPDIMQQGYSHSAIVTLKNNSCVNIFFSWQIPDVTNIVKVNHFSVTPMKGQVNAMDKIELQVRMNARNIGRVQEKLFCEITGGPKLVLHIEGSIQGPHLQLSPIFLDFGIVQVGRVASLHFTITNKNASSVSYNLCTAPIQQKTTDDHSKVLAETLNLVKIGPQNIPSKSKFQEKNLSSLMTVPRSHGRVSLDSNNAVGEKVVHQRLHAELSLFPSNGAIPPKGSVDVEVKLSPLNHGRCRWAIICEILDGKVPPLYAVVNTFATAPDVCVCPSNFDLGIVYLDLALKNKVSLQNLCGLPVQFQWLKNAVNNSASVVLEFLPQEGVLSPYGVEEVTINVTPKVPGENKLIVFCNISGMLHPIQLTFRFYVLDIFCSYYVFQYLDLCNSDSHIQSIDRTKLPVLDFGKKRSLGVMHCLSVKLQNETGIPGRIHAYIEKYDVKSFLSHNQVVELTRTCSNSEIAATGILDDISQYCIYRYATDSVRANMVHKLWSSACSRVGQGFAVLLSCYEGSIQAWKSWNCDVYCFGCMPGTYKDTLYFKVGNSCTVQIPIAITLVGSPLSLRDNHFCSQGCGPIEESRVMVFKWISKPAGSPPRSRKFWVSNSAYRPIELEWEKKEQVISTGQAGIKVHFEVDDEVKVHLFMLGDPDKGPIQLKFVVEECTFVHVVLKELFKSVSYDLPFQIEPAKQCIPAAGSALFTVTFYSEDVGRFCLNLIGKTDIDELLFKTCNVGTMKSDVDVTHCLPAYDDTIYVANSLSVCLEAATFPPVLKSNVDESVEFYFLATGPPSQNTNTREITLSNDYDYDLCFNVTLTTPFFVVKTCKSSSLGPDETQFSYDSLSDITLPPKYMLTLQVDFKPSTEMLYNRDDLMIENDLVICFSSRFYQKVPMIGYLEFPKVISYIESISFGTVLIGSSLTLPFTIINKGKVDATWHLEKKTMLEKSVPSDAVNRFASVQTSEEIQGHPIDDSIFTFDTHEGLLKSSSKSLPSQETINVKFSPQEKSSYYYKISIDVFGGRGVTIFLNGEGVTEQASNQNPVEPIKKKSLRKGKRSTTK